MIFLRVFASLVFLSIISPFILFGATAPNEVSSIFGDSVAANRDPASWIFVIGVPSPDSISGASTVVNDAMAVLAAMKKQFRIKEEQTIALIGPSATKQNIQQGFERLVAESAPDDHVFFFYSGQTMTVSITGNSESVFITSVGEQGSSMLQNAVSFEQINAWTNSIRANRMFMVFNSCFGSEGESVPRTKQTSTKDIRIRNMLVAGESKQQQYMSRRTGMSLFAYYIIEGLKNIAADRDRNTVLTSYELSEYVASNVKIESRRTQQPYTAGIGSARAPHFIFTGPVRKVISKTIVTQQQSIRVFQDSIYLGSTPLTIALDGDSVRYRLTGDGFMDQFLDVSSSTAQDVFFVNMVPSGRIRIVTMPPGAQVFINDTFYGLSPLFIPKVPLGISRVILRKEFYEDIVNEQEVTTSDPLVIDVRMIKKKGSITLSGVQGGADIEVSSPAFSEKLTMLPLKNHQIDHGIYRVTVSKPGYSTFNTDVTIGSSPTTVPVLMEKKSLNLSRIVSFVLPGTGQIYMGRPVAGWGLFAGFVFTTVEASLSYDRYLRERESYLHFQQQYAAAVTVGDLNDRYKKMDAAYGAMTVQRNRFFTFAGISGVLYVAGVVDAYLFEPEPLLSVDDLSLSVGPNALHLRYIW